MSTKNKYKKQKYLHYFVVHSQHYKSTFQAATNISGGPADHRRQACLPPPDNEIPISFKNAPMSGLSSQRDHYQPPPPDSIKKLSPAPVKQVYLFI